MCSEAGMDMSPKEMYVDRVELLGKRIKTYQTKRVNYEDFGYMKELLAPGVTFLWSRLQKMRKQFQK